MEGGRPKKIKSAAEFKRLADAYFAQCDEDDEPYTVTGLILGVGLTSHQSLAEYSKYKGFTETVRAARMKVEQSYEKSLRSTAATGSIFALKSMHGWRDVISNEHTGKDGQPIQFEDMTVRFVG